MNRNEFLTRQHDEVRETLERLREHAMAFEEKIQEGDTEEWMPLAEEAKAGAAGPGANS